MLQPFSRWYLVISTLSALVAILAQGTTLKYFHNLETNDGTFAFPFLLSILMRRKY